MTAINKLYQSGFKGEVLWNCHWFFIIYHIVGLLSVIFLVAFSQHLYIIEKRAAKLAGRLTNQINLNERLNTICTNLADKVRKEVDQPLRSCFITRSEQFIPVRSRTPILPTNRLNKLMNSFAKFYHPLSFILAFVLSAFLNTLFTSLLLLIAFLPSIY